MYCGNCGKEVKDSMKFCPYCGEQIIEGDVVTEENKSSNSTIDNKPLEQSDKTTATIMNLIIILLILLSLIIVGPIVKSTFTPIIDRILKGISVKAPDCESDEVKNLAVDIFKQNNTYYSAIDDSSIASIELIYPAKKSYDSSIDKYSCQGEIVMTASNSGFTPTEHKYPNKYYSKIHSWYGNDLKTYTQYKCRIEYSSQLSEGKTLVYSNYCGNGGGDFE